MNTTTAVIVAAPDQIGFGNVEMPSPEPGEVQVHTRYSLISPGTETWVNANRFTWAATPYPMVPGYQRCGQVVAVGAGVSAFRPGDMVIATCGSWAGPVRPFWGAHVARANTVASECRRIPPGVDPLDAAGLVVAQVGYNAASRLDLAPGDWVAVWGDGIIGLCAAQAARARGARVVLVGRRPYRLAAGRSVGIEATIAAQADTVAAVRAAIAASTVRAVIDTVQSEQAQHTYVGLLEQGRGQVVYSGFTPGTCWADMAVLQQRELTTHFVQGWNDQRMAATLDLMATGQMRLKALISQVLPACEAPTAYRLLRQHGADVTSIAFAWETP